MGSSLLVLSAAGLVAFEFSLTASNGTPYLLRLFRFSGYLTY